MATRRSPQSPLQTSVRPSEATAIVPRFSSPVKRTAEDGSRKVALHVFPKLMIYFIFCESKVGNAFVKVNEEMILKERKTLSYLINPVEGFRLILWCHRQNDLHQNLTGEQNSSS
jgi:hypothetical protein